MGELFAARKDFECPYAKVIARIQGTVVCAALLLTDSPVLNKGRRAHEGVKRHSHYHTWHSIA